MGTIIELIFLNKLHKKIAPIVGSDFWLPSITKKFT